MHHFKRIISILLAVLLVTDTFGVGAFEMANAASPQVAATATTAKAATAGKTTPAATSKPIKYDPPQIADPNWAELDWDREVVLPQDVEEYQKSVADLVAHNKFNEVKNLKQKTHKMSEEGAMQHFRTPLSVQKTVLQYTQNGKKPVLNKDELKYKIKSLDLPVPLPQAAKLQGKDESQIIDLSKAKKANIKQAIPYTAPKENSTLKDFKTLPPAQKRTNAKFEYKIFNAPTVVAPNGKSLLEGIKLFFVPAAKAQAAVPLIEYYDGIEKNVMDFALYYISTQQNENGSFGKSNKFIVTSEVVDSLAQWGRNDNDVFNSAMDFLTAYVPENIEEKAVKVRFLRAIGQNYDALLGEILAAKNDDGGYGFKEGYTSDTISTIEVLNTLTSIQYNADNKPLQALAYILMQVRNDGSMYFTGEGDPGYYLINKTLSAIYPYRGYSVGDGASNIFVQAKIDVLLGFLRNSYSEDLQKLLASNDAIDEAMTAQSFEIYNTETVKRELIKNHLKEMQYSDGSFGKSPRATVKAMLVLAESDIVIENITANGALVNRSAASFTLTLKNKGFKETTGTDLYLFVDNFHFGSNQNLENNGLILAPNSSATLNYTVQDTISFIGQTNVKFYMEPDKDSDYSNNWRAQDFNFAPPANNAPALQPFYMAQKDAGPALGLNVNWGKKNDNNRDSYIIRVREKGTQQWTDASVDNGSGGAFVHGNFVAGKTYEVTVGVVYQDMTTVTYFAATTDVAMGGADPSSYTGTVSGFVTENATKVSGIFTNGYGTTVSGNTGENGNFTYQNVANGSSAARVRLDQYEELYEKFSVGVGSTTSNIRIFARLKEDNVAPVLNDLWIDPGRWTRVIRNQMEAAVNVSVGDNIKAKEVDYYYRDPQAQSWIYIGTAAPQDAGMGFAYKWYIPPELIGEGYKVKAVARDFRGNESAPFEWGPFTIVNGAPPKFTITSPNGGQSLPLGSTQTVTWSTQAANSVSKVHIYSVYPDGKETAASNINNTGSYNWTIPVDANYVGDNVKIRIEGIDDINFQPGYDESDAGFKIIDNSASPQSPWERPITLSDTSQYNPPNGNIQVVPVIRSDKNGGTHTVYRYLYDQVQDNGRTITEQLIYRKKQGDVWSNPAVVYQKIWQTDLNLIGYTPISDLKMELDSLGNPTLLWGGTPAGDCRQNNNTEIYSIRYDGANWSEATNVSNNNTYSRDHDLATDSQGNVYAVWTDGLSWDNACGVSGNAKINYKKRNPAGSWEAVQRLDQIVNPSYPQIAITADNKIHILYYDGSATEVRHIYYNGNIWSAPLTVFQGNAFAQKLRIGPNSTLHYVFQQSYQNRTRVMYNNYDGIAWGAAGEVSPAVLGYDARFPTLAVDNSGRPNVLFEYSNQGTSLKNVVWTMKENGQWLAPQTINLPSNRQIRDGSATVDFDNNHMLFAVWIDQYSRNAELIYNQADLTKDFTAPAPVQGFQLEATASAVGMKWTLYANADNDFDHFSIYRTVNAQDKIENLQPLVRMANIAGVKYLDSTALRDGTAYYYAITVTDTAGNENKNLNFQGPISPGRPMPLEKPILIAPGDKSSVTTLTPTLQWFEPYNSPDRRNFQWYIKDAATGQIVWNRTLNNPDGGVAVCQIPGLVRTWTCLTATVPAGKLKPGKTYLWAVEAKNGAASSGFSRESSFSTELLHNTIALMPGPFANRAPNKPVPIGPANGALATWPLTLRWRDGGDDNKPNLFRNYEWKITDAVSGQIIWNRTWDAPAGGPTSCQPLANRASSWTCLGVMVPDGLLVPGRRYSWSVEASDGTLSSGYTVPWTFTAPSPPANIAPNKPALLTPVPNASVSLPVRLTWTDGGDSDNKPNTTRNYEWYIRDSNGITVWNRTWNNPDGGGLNCPVTAGLIRTWKCEYAIVPNGKLEPGKTYTWAVETSDGALSSGYAVASTFTVTPP